MAKKLTELEQHILVTLAEQPGEPVQNYSSFGDFDRHHHDEFDIATDALIEAGLIFYGTPPYKPGWYITEAGLAVELQYQVRGETKMSDDNKPGMKNIDPNKPLFDDRGIQLRLVTLMCHPDYNLDKAFNGKGKIGFNRNEELDEMSIVDLLLDAKRVLEEKIDQGEHHFVTSYAYAGFMTDSWQRAIELDIVIDPDYQREDYVDRNRYYNGRVALTMRRARQQSK